MKRKRENVIVPRTGVDCFAISHQLHQQQSAVLYQELRMSPKTMESICIVMFYTLSTINAQTLLIHTEQTPLRTPHTTVHRHLFIRTTKHHKKYKASFDGQPPSQKGQLTSSISHQSFLNEREPLRPK